MKYNLLIFFSFFSLLICVEYMEVPFELNYFDQSESKLYELMKKVFIDVESSIGQKQEKFKLALDQESISIAVPDINLKNPSGNFKKFDISSSDTFQMTHNFSQIILYDERFSKGIEGNDSFKLGENKVSIINFTVANEYKFNYSPLTYNYAYLGLKMEINSPSNLINNLLEQLKISKLISHESWYLNFISDNKGTFVIGGLPHEIDGKAFPENSKITDPTSEYSQLYNMKFNEIYYGKIEDFDKREKTENKDVHFTLTTKYMICTDDFWTIISPFFTDKIRNNICQTTGLTADNYIYYYCYKDKFIMSEMQNVNFYLKSFNFTFVFEPKDLFYEKDGILYFLITTKKEEGENYQWNLGTTFLEKYIVAFNKDDKLRYFYEKNKKQDNPVDSGSNDSIYIIIISVLSVVFIACIGFFVFYIIKIKPRKKKANELDEDFDYQAKDNEKGTTPILNE